MPLHPGLSLVALHPKVEAPIFMSVPAPDDAPTVVCVHCQCTTPELYAHGRTAPNLVHTPLSTPTCTPPVHTPRVHTPVNTPP